MIIQPTLIVTEKAIAEPLMTSAVEKTAIQNGHTDVSPTSESTSKSTPQPVKPLVLSRDEFFPREIAAKHGLDPDEFATIHVADQSGLYDHLILYAAHFAVDLHASLPPSPVGIVAEPTKSSSSKKTKSKKPSKSKSKLKAASSKTSGDQSPCDINDKTSNRPIQSDTTETTDAKKTPTIVRSNTEKNDVDDGNEADGEGEDIGDIENSNDNDDVDNVPDDRAATTKIISDLPSYRNQTKEQLFKRLVEKTSNGHLIARREGEGEVSTLLYGVRDDYEWSESSSSSSDDSDDSDSDDSDSDSSTLDSISNDEINIYHTGGIRSFGLRRLASPRVHRFRLGVGFCKFRAGNEVVLMHHMAMRDAFERSWDRPDLMMTVVLAARDAKILKEACAIVQRWNVRRHEAVKNCGQQYFTLYRFRTKEDGCGKWFKQASKRSRPANSIILRDGMLKEILEDIKEFVSRDTKSWYVKHGLPHRRSLLFYGPPGCGKTSTIKMLAGTFGLNACFLSFTKPDFSNQSLHDAISDLPVRPLLVLEDVDVLFNEDRKNDSVGTVTFSGLLNALDGLVSVDGIITIFTTNHLDKLDSSLIRGGRVDRRFEFENPNKRHLMKLFKSFYDDSSDELAKSFADAVLNRPEPEARSIATLQQHFIFTRKLSAEESVKKVPEFFTKFYPGAKKQRNSLYI